MTTAPLGSNDVAKALIDGALAAFRSNKRWADKAVAQLPEEKLHIALDPNTNCIAVIMKHVAGNLLSRWTDFLTTDGEKPWRDRDAEFVIGSDDSRDRLLAAWEEGWAALFRTLADLREEDLLKRVTIRGEEHTVLQAVHRSLTHTSYHTGQILYVARLVKRDGWRWITIAPGQSKEYRAQGRKYLH